MMVMGFDEQAQCSTDNDLYVHILSCYANPPILDNHVLTKTRQKAPPPVLARAIRISDILRLMSREVRGTETRYLAVVGTREHGIGNMSENDGKWANV